MGWEEHLWHVYVYVLFTVLRMQCVWLTDMADGRTNTTDPCSLDHDRDHVDSSGSSADASSGGDGPFVVVYMIDSFTYGTQVADADEMVASRLATVGLLQCYSGMLRAIPDHLRSCIQLQVCACCLDIIWAVYWRCVLASTIYADYLKSTFSNWPILCPGVRRKTLTQSVCHYVEEIAPQSQKHISA